ncbi:hypothetical protein [Geodermatophilus sp. URMC 60]
MPPFQNSRVRPVRGTVVAAAAGALLLTGAPAAIAAPIAAPVLTVPLDPPDVMVLLLPTENLEGLEEAPAEDWVPSAVTVQWEGSVTVELPEPLDAGTAPLVTLEIGHEEDPAPLVTYSSDPATTDPAAPDPLAVTPLGDGAYDIAMPADDGAGGEVAVLTVEDVVAEEATGIEVLPVSYLLRLDADADASRTLAPQVLALSSPSCPLNTADDCSGYEVTAGDTLELTVPERSRLRALGLGTLTGLQAGLESIDEESWSDEPADTDESTAVLAAAAAYTEVPELAGLAAGSAPTGAAPAFTASAVPAPVGAAEPLGGVLEPTEVRSLPVDSAEPYRATVTVPADTAAGSYVLGLTEVDPDTGSASVTVLVLEVAAAPVAPPPAPEAVAPVTAAPVLNPGLRSNTGVVAAPAVGTSSGGSGTVAVGAGLLLLSGVGGVAVARSRRRPAAGCGS